MPPRARKSTDPAPDTVETVEEVPDGDVQRYADAMQPRYVEDHGGDRASWPLEETVLYKVPHVAQREIVTQLLAAANELGYPADAVKTHSEGFVVPSKIYYHLFPSQIPDPE